MFSPSRSWGVCFAAAVLVTSCQDDAPPPEHACSGASALSVAAFDGGSLPPKTLALTFDDGPGVRTLELSAWLRDHGIRAAFFVNGKNVRNDSDLAQIAKDGHLVGNHTQTHRSLTGHATGTARLSDGDVRNEIEQTDALIASHVDRGRFLFRPPYGDWDGTTYSQVDGTAMTKYVGPVLWNIGNNMSAHSAADWDCWQPATDGKVLTVDQCGALYLEEIETKGHGIVLMHDFYFRYGDPSQGGTVDMVKGLVPTLLAKGYTFVRVDEVPDIAAKLPSLPDSPHQVESGARAVVAPRQKRDDTARSSSAIPPRNTAPHAAKADPCAPSPQDQADKSTP